MNEECAILSRCLPLYVAPRVGSDYQLVVKEVSCGDLFEGPVSHIRPLPPIPIIIIYAHCVVNDAQLYQNSIAQVAFV